MSPAALALILVAALAHASWNLFSKQASTTGRHAFVWLLAAVAAVAYAPVAAATVLLTHPHLTAMNWLFMAGTGVLEAGYFLFLQSGYRLGDLSLVYPIGRGTGALLATLAGILLFGERPGPVELAGIAAIIAGIVVIGLPGRSPAARPGPESRTQLRAIGFALATGAFIASYTLWDKYAVGTLRTPPVLQGYATFPIVLLAFAPLAWRHSPTPPPAEASPSAGGPPEPGQPAGGRQEPGQQNPRQLWQSFRPQVIAAGLLAPLAYILVLVALSFTAVSAVAPAREISVLFGVILGRRLLGEGSLARKLTAAAAIAAGIIAVAIS